MAAPLKAAAAPIPWMDKSKTSKKGAHSPNIVYPGKIPIESVGIEISKTLDIKEVFLPYLSPMYPKIMPPSGFITNRAAKINRTLSCLDFESTSGKKRGAMKGE